MKKSINSITWNRLHLIILGLILIFSFAVRFNQIATVPTGALIDEAHFGYLAYSLLETGKDEHGVSWPLLFKGFGDYPKLPMGVYALLPFVKFLGLNNAVIRYPSVLAGTLIVLGAYLLIRAVTSSKRLSLGALITATSPWTFVLSRFGFESNLALCFLYFCSLVNSTRYPESIIN